MRHYYDSLRFPFLTDLLFSQLLNFDWESSRKEIEDQRKKKECKDEDRCNYLQVLNDDFNRGIKFYSPTFELIDGQYVYKTFVPKQMDPKDITISIDNNQFYFSYKYKTENGESSSAVFETLPEDLDTDSLKAVVKNGAVTITAKQVAKKPEPPKEPEEDVEYEIEIEK
jgi:HSP20 family molecular chaperone IbpA